MNSLDLISERQCAGIYRAFETRNLARAIAEADKLLKKQPTLLLAKALKALAAAQLHKHKEAGALCDQLLALQQAFTPAVVLPLSHALSEIDRDDDSLNVLEVTSKAHPDAEDVADQCFFALIQAKLYQRAQQTAQRMHKTLKKDLYFWWSIQAYELLGSRQPGAQGAALALPLCERMITQQLKSKPLTGKSDELAHLYLTILHKLGKDKEALVILSPSSEIGAQLCKRSLALELMRRELWAATGAWDLVREEALFKLKAGETDWAYVYALCQSSAKLDAAANPDSAAPSLLKEARHFLQDRLGADRFTRVGSLATLETFAQQKLLSKEGSLSAQTLELVQTTIEAHLEAFGGKACAAGDVLPYLLELLSDAEIGAVKTKLVEQFKTFTGSYASEEELARHLTAIRLIQAIERRRKTSLTFDARTLAKRYAAGLPIGTHLPDTEGQPADELGIITAQRILSQAPEDDLSAIFEAAIFLQYCCHRSKKGYRLRVFLVRLLLQLGLFTRASQHWDHLKTAFIQHDTLGHLLLDQGAVLSHGGDLEAAEVVERLRQAQKVYNSNTNDTNEMIKVAFQNGTFSKIEEVVDFGERVDRSFSRQLYRLEHAKLALVGRDGSAQPGTQSSIAAIKTDVQGVLATLREGPLSDQRDFTILPPAHDAQPHFRPDSHVLLGPLLTEADILADAGVLAVASGVALTDAEVEALRSYVGEKKAVVIAALAVHGFEIGQVDSNEVLSAFDSFFTERITQIGDATAPWRLLQQTAHAVQAASLLKLSVHRAKDSKGSVASELEATLKALKPRLDEVVGAVKASTVRIGDALRQCRDGSGVRKEGVLGTIAQSDEMLVDSFVEDTAARVQAQLDEALRAVQSKLAAIYL